MKVKAEPISLEKHYIEQETRKDRTSNTLVFALIAVVMLLAVVRVIIANVSVDASEKLKNLDAKITALEAENELRSERIHTKESLMTLSGKANVAGFQKVGKYDFVEPAGPVAAAFDEFHN